MYKITRNAFEKYVYSSEISSSYGSEYEDGCLLGHLHMDTIRIYLTISVFSPEILRLIRFIVDSLSFCR
jgi:hypothetical protein